MTTHDPLARLASRAAADRQDTAHPADMPRILALPRLLYSTDPDNPVTQGLVKKWTERLRSHPDAWPLRPVQAIAMEELSALKDIPGVGGLYSIGVGWGKTLISLLAGRALGCERVVLLVPPDAVSGGQLDKDIWTWHQHYGFTDPTVVPYSMLSQPSSTDLLRRLNPDLIVADECQNLKNATAARTKRFLRYLEENPQTRFVAMSGTLTSKGLSEYAHLGYLALRERCPVPINERARKDWAAVLDADTEPEGTDWLRMSPLVEWSGRRWNPPGTEDAGPADFEAVRGAYNDRMASAPGVICTTSPSCEAALEIRGHMRGFAMSATANAALDTLKEDYVLPNGEEVFDALSFIRAARQLAMGFYYYWDWDALDGEVDWDWLEARRDWASQVRKYLSQNGREGVDSPFLVERYVRDSVTQGKQVAPALTRALAAWDEQRHKDPPPTKARWLDFSIIAWAARWAKNQDRAFIWFTSRAVGHMLQKYGIPTFWEGDPKQPDTPIAALSTTVYNKMWNFQPWSKQLILEPPANAAIFEQLLGRTHRPGQQAETVSADVLIHRWPLVDAFQTARSRAAYIQATTGQIQKLCFATYTGAPAHPSQA